jgi:hypothetical protein
VFSQATITNVFPPVILAGELLLSWQSSSPAGTWFQVYFNRALAWYGTSTTTSIAYPTAVSRIDIGTVGPGEQQTNFAADLPTAPDLYAEIAWLGGTFEGADIAGFNVYGADGAGGAVDYSSVLSTVPAYTAGVINDGFGLGGFGEGGFGEAASTYSWTAGPLSTGTWTFGVVPFDTAGNLGTAATASVTIHAPPLEPAPFPDYTRLHYTYAAPPYEITLLWNPTPTPP